MWPTAAHQIKLDGQMSALPEPPPAMAVEPSHCTRQSIETLVVVLAAITILGVIAGIFARVCGGRHSGGGDGESDIEGWVERSCKSCIDGGLPAPLPLPPAEAAEEKK